MYHRLSLNLPPGSILGPCGQHCRHTDCHYARRQARSRCPLCGRRVGYCRPFTDTLDGHGSRVTVHADCLIRHLRDRGAEVAEELIVQCRTLAGLIGSGERADALSRAADAAESALRVEP